MLRLLSERREDLVAERTRALNRLHGLLRDLLPGGVSGTLPADRVASILRGIRPKGGAPRPASGGAWPRGGAARRPRTLDRKIALTWVGASRPRWGSLRHHPHRDLRHRSHPGR